MESESPRCTFCAYRRASSRVRADPHPTRWGRAGSERESWGRAPTVSERRALQPLLLHLARRLGDRSSQPLALKPTHWTQHLISLHFRFRCRDQLRWNRVPRQLGSTPLVGERVSHVEVVSNSKSSRSAFTVGRVAGSGAKAVSRPCGKSTGSSTAPLLTALR